MARTFIIPGRLMYLRPLKHKPHVKKRRRRYDAVWANAEVGVCKKKTDGMLELHA